MTSISASTYPLIDETPTTSKAKLPLSGVKTTLKRVAVKLELSWQGFSDDDSISRSADANGASVESAASESQAGFDNDEKSMLV